MVRQSERSAATIGVILDAARKLFTEKGFQDTSVDDIAEAAGVTKGAVYHHFDSKIDLFTEVLEAIQRELAALPPPASRRGAKPPERIAAAVHGYLIGSTHPSRRRILLIDGPAVIGWRKWREIDYRIFGAGARAGLAAWLTAADEAQIDVATHLLMGAVTEAALVCATAPSREKAAQHFTTAVSRMLEGLARWPA